MSDSSDLHDCRDRLERSSFAERVTLLAQIASDRSNDLSEIHLLCSLNSVDRSAFVEAMRRCVASNARNVSALQALLWAARRLSLHEEARAAALKLLALAPTDRGLMRDLFQSEIVEPSADAERHLELSMASLDDPLARFSCAYQAGMRFADRARPDQRSQLLSEIRRVADDIVERTVAGASADPDDADRVWTDVCRRIMEARSIAVVGNGSSLTGKEYGVHIDACDLVIRINFPTLFGYEADVGRRTDVVIFSEGLLSRLPAFLNRDRAYQSLPVLAISPFPADEPLHVDPCLNGQRLSRVPSHVRMRLTAFSYGLATTGCLVLCLCALITSADIDVYGFDFYRDENRPHYFEEHDQVFLGHDVTYERFLVEEMIPSLR